VEPIDGMELTTPDEPTVDVDHDSTRSSRGSAR
jgi:hypothetical protein